MTFVPTAEQSAVIEHPPAPLLVVAGAGTGKTSVVAARILHLVEGGTTPDQIVALTFTNKATANLKQRVLERLGPDADVTVATYHAFGASLVAAHGLELGLDPGTQVLNRAQAWQLLFAVFDDFRFERRSAYVPSLVVDDALQLASRIADHLVSVEDVAADCEQVMDEGRWKRQRETAAKRLELCQVVAAYQRRKRARNLIDYGDQIALAVRLLREQPALAAALGQQHPIALLDEYQDTNYAQRVLLQLVYPPGSPVTAVGDDMQSIYGFRGAHLGNIMAFSEHFPPAERKALETNRRSGPELVTLANRIQGQVPRALPKTLGPLGGAPSTSIECFLAADDAEEAAEIARDVVALGPPWSDHAVLCRKRRLIGAVVAALEDQGVPVDAVGAGGLLQRPEVVDLVSWLEVLADPSSIVALLRILQGPRYRIGWRDLGALSRHARQLGTAGQEPADLSEALERLGTTAALSGAARARLAAFRSERRVLSALAGRLSVLDLAEAITSRTGLWAAAGERGRENLLRFFDLAARFSPVEGDPGLPAFVEYLRLLDETEEDLAEAHAADHEAVRVMTVHQAKGLEFANVWVPGLAGGSGRGWGIFPDARLGENPLGLPSALPSWVRPDDEGMPHWRHVAREADLTDEIRRQREDEEWRLLYVACTRARRRLVCSAAHWYPGPAEPQGPSVFYDFVAAQADLVTERFRHDAPTVDPAAAARERRRASAVRPALPPVEVDEPPLFDAAPAGGTAPAPSGRRPAETTTFSATGLVAYARCPLQFYWSFVRPLPRRPSSSARVGTEVHRWIEERAGRQLALLEPEPEEGDADPSLTGTGPGGGGVTAALRAAFLAGPYAALDPVRVEAPFQLILDGRLVRGRIDAVYEREDRLELVDFKTGRRPVAGDPGAHVQLAVYALAAVETWRAAPERIRTTYCYLRPDGTYDLDSTDWDARRIEAVRSALRTSMDAASAERFEAQAGAWCTHCEFLPFCRTGQAATA
ncbi:MAG: ATP-dependent helicase [Actinomycetota bacterium]|nr:ATP-dependent helicase [Actinomycetota bacterium]